MIDKLKENFKIIDKTVFFLTWIALLCLSIPIIVFPEKSGVIVSKLNSIVINYFGSAYMIFGIFCVVFCLWISFSRYGKIKLGDEGEKPEFNLFSWVAMLFCCGVGAGVVYWGFIEWAYYYQSPPLGLEKGTWQAAEMASAYGFFHWGPTAWAIYAVSACAFGYLLFVRKSSIFKASEACRGALGKKIDGVFGRMLDVFFIFGIVGAVATSLGLGSPLITAAIANVFNIKITIWVELSVLLLISAIFGLSAFSGLKRGIKVLSDLNVWIALFFVTFVFIVGKPKFLLDTTVTAMGLMAQNFIRMSTWLDSIGLSMFPQSWTVFYWAWWAGYAPFMGMFFARISRGRTVRQMVIGTIIFGSLGCILFFGVLGNYGLNLQITGKMDVINSLATVGAPQTIVAIINTLPLGKFLVAIVGILCIVFAATSYDSASYIIAANSQKYVIEGESITWLRLLWAFGLALIPIGFIMLKAPLNILQTATLVLSIPVVLIVVLSSVSFVNMVKEDIKNGKLKQKMVLQDFQELLDK